MGVTGHVDLVINGKMKEEVAIQNFKSHKNHQNQIKRQKELMKSNIECRRRINIATKDPLYEANR